MNKKVDTMQLKQVVKSLEESIENHLTELRIGDLSQQAIEAKHEIIKRLLSTANEKREKLHVSTTYQKTCYRDSKPVEINDLYDLIDSVS